MTVTKKSYGLLRKHNYASFLELSHKTLVASKQFLKILDGKLGELFFFRFEQTSKFVEATFVRDMTFRYPRSQFAFIYVLFTLLGYWCWNIQFLTDANEFMNVEMMESQHWLLC